MKEPVLHSFTAERGFWEESTFWNPSWVPGNANMTSNLDDMHIWAETLGEGKLLSASSSRIQFAPTTVGMGANNADRYYALGTIVTNNWIVQNPGIMGYDDINAYLPSQKLTVVIFTTATKQANHDVTHSTPIFRAIGNLLAPDTPPKL